MGDLSLGANPYASLYVHMPCELVPPAFAVSRLPISRSVQGTDLPHAVLAFEHTLCHTVTPLGRGLGALLVDKGNYRYALVNMSSCRLLTLQETGEARSFFPVY